jgi:hypothetical protein
MEFVVTTDELLGTPQSFITDLNKTCSTLPPAEDIIFIMLDDKQLCPLLW